MKNVDINFELSVFLGPLDHDEYRTGTYVQTKSSEEVGELSDEILLSLSGEKAGKDGVCGEIVDVMLCALDMFALYEKTDSVVAIKKAFVDTLQDVTKLKIETFEDILKTQYKIQPGFMHFLNISKHVGLMAEHMLNESDMSYKAKKENALRQQCVIIFIECACFLKTVLGKKHDNEVSDFFDEYNQKKITKWKNSRT